MVEWFPAAMITQESHLALYPTFQKGKCNVIAAALILVSAGYVNQIVPN